MQTYKGFQEYQIKKLFESIGSSEIDIRNKAAFHLMLFAGLRVSEASSFERSCYVDERKFLRCKRLKNSNTNNLYIDSAECQYALDKWCSIRDKKYPNSKWLFPSPVKNGETHLDRRTFDRHLRKYCAAAGLFECQELWHCHSFKHTCGYRLANAGLNPREMQFWLGHKSASNTQIYTYLGMAQIRRIYCIRREYMKRLSKKLPLENGGFWGSHDKE